MKKIYAFMLALCMILSAFGLSACKDSKTTNIYADLEEFDSYVDEDSDIIGTWVMTSPDTNYEWQFFTNTTLHQTKINGDIRSTTVCTFNYDGEGTLKIYGLSAKEESQYTAKIDNNTLTLTDANNGKITFDKK